MGAATITSPPLTTPLYFPKTVTMQEPTSEYPEPSVVLQPSDTTPPSVLSQEACSEKQLDLFLIGLEILGEKEKERFLLYLLSLQKSHRENQEDKQGEL